MKFIKLRATVNKRSEEARQLGTSDNISERVATATTKRLSILDGLKDKVPEKAR